MSQNSKALAKLGLSTELLLEAFLGSQPTSREDLTRQVLLTASTAFVFFHDFLVTLVSGALGLLVCLLPSQL
jgi:hypothetical protein